VRVRKVAIAALKKAAREAMGSLVDGMDTGIISSMAGSLSRIPAKVFWIIQPIWQDGAVRLIAWTNGNV
jgi:hypothetical protein